MSNSKNKMLVALLDEYERATNDLKQLVLPLSKLEFLKDREPKSISSRVSIKDVIEHVVEAGLVYANDIAELDDLEQNNLNSIGTVLNSKNAFDSIDSIIIAMDNALEKMYPRSKKEIMSHRIKIGETHFCDIEQQLEHAIVHILRHRRQIENWLKSF